MHSFSIDSTERRLITGALGVGAALLVPLLQSLGAGEDALFSPTLASWLSGLTPFALFGLLYLGVDRFAWRYIPLVVRTPNLNGAWEGRLSSSFNEFDGDAPTTLHIRQTWTRIHIHQRTEKSESDSVMAAIEEDRAGGVRLRYSYGNDPDPDTPGTQSAHSGACALKLSDDGKVLSGNYFTNRDPMTRGKLVFTRKESR